MRKDIESLLERAGIEDFEYIEIRAIERHRAAAARWPLLVLTNRLLGVLSDDPIDAPQAIPRVSSYYQVLAQEDPEARRVENTFPLLTSTRRYSTMPKQD